MKMRKLNIYVLLGIGFFSFVCAGFAAAGNGSSVSELITPAQKSQAVYPFPNFSWSEHPAAFKDAGKPVSYKIQIAADKDFHEIVDSDTVYLNRYVHDRPFSPGAYYWRVCAVPFEMPQTLWSSSGTFTIKSYDHQLTVNPSKQAKDQVLQVQSAVAKAMDIAKKGRSVKIKFAPGDYRIDQSLHGPLIDLAGVSNILVDGTGARLHFTSRKQGLIRAAYCENIAIMGFSSSYAKGALRIQGHVKAIDLENQRVTVSIEPGFPDFTVSDSQTHDIFYLFEPNKRGRLKTATPNFFRAVGGFTKNDDNTWSFKLSRPADQWKVGDRYSFNFRGSSVQFVDFGDSSSVTAYDLKNSGWGAMQYVSKNGSLFNILNCSTPFDEGKWMTGNADGVHIRGHKIGPWIEGLKIQAIGDDAIALYARPASIKSLVSDSSNSSRTVICKNEFFNLESGDEVSFFQPLKGAVILETIVEKVVDVDGGFKVTFRDPLPKGLKLDGPLVEATQIWNRSKSCGDFMVRDSEFTNIRRYGTVFRSKRGVVENCTYSGTSSRAIVFINGTQWPNGLYASEIIVRNNSVTDCGFESLSPIAPISFIFNGYKRSASTIGPRNILIEDNTIQDCSSPEILLTRTANAVVRNNNTKLPSGKKVPATLSAQHCEKIRQ